MIFKFFKDKIEPAIFKNLIVQKFSIMMHLVSVLFLYY